MKLRISRGVASLIISIAGVAIVFALVSRLDKSQVRGYARQIYNFVNGDGNLSNISIRSVDQLGDTSVPGLQHSLSIKSMDLSSITDIWGPPRYSSPAYLFTVGRETYVVNFKGEIYHHRGVGSLKKIESNLARLLEQQDYKSIDPDSKEDLSGRLGIKSIAYNGVNKSVHVVFHEKVRESQYALAVYKAEFGSELHFQRLFLGNFARANFNAHDSGGRLAFVGGDTVLTIGAFDISQFSDKGEISRLRDRQSEVGAVVRIDASGRSKVLSKGHRNQQGLAIHDGKIFITEHGPMGGDQFICVRDGDDYGWPYYSYGFDYNFRDVYNRPKGPKFSEPVFYFTPSIAPSQLVFYAGDEFPRFRNKFILASLKRASLFVLSSDDFSSRVQSVEEYFIGHRIRDLVVGADGKLLLATDDARLLVVSRDHSDIPDRK